MSTEGAMELSDMATRVITSEQELRDLILLGVTGPYKALNGQDDSDWPLPAEMAWAKGERPDANEAMARQIYCKCYVLETE